MSTITITIKTDSAAFRDSKPTNRPKPTPPECRVGREVARILRVLAEDFWNTGVPLLPPATTLLDINGNVVGSVEVAD